MDHQRPTVFDTRRGLAPHLGRLAQPLDRINRIDHDTARHQSVQHDDEVECRMKHLGSEHKCSVF